VDEIFNLEKNPNLPMEELTAMLEEFRKCARCWLGCTAAPQPPSGRCRAVLQPPGSMR
jgi:hypothetical protein